MFPFIVAAIILFLGLALGGLVVINRTAQVEFQNLARDIAQQFTAIRTLATTQNANIALLLPAIKAYTTYEQDTFTACVKAGERLNHAKTPAQLEDANKATNKALQALTTISGYYPPLLASRDYLIAQEKIAATAAALQKAIVHYNTEVQEYNTKLNQFSNRILAKRVGLQPADKIMLSV